MKKEFDLGFGPMQSLAILREAISGQSGLVLNSPKIQGTIDPGTGLTLPAVTLGGAVTLNGKTFDAGAVSAKMTTSGSLKGLVLENTGTTHGCSILFEHTDTTPIANNRIGRIRFDGFDGNASPQPMLWGLFEAEYDNVGDGSEEILFRWVGVTGGVPDNVAMSLTGAGGLNVDANLSVAYLDDDHPVGVTVADAFDDALVLREGVSQGQMEVLERVGVMSRKDTGSGWMMNVTRFSYLLAGGIYQNRAKIDDLVERLNKLELSLPIGKN